MSIREIRNRGCRTVRLEKQSPESRGLWRQGSPRRGAEFINALASSQQLGASSWFYMHKASHIPAIDKPDDAVHLRKEGVVFTASDVLARFQTSAALPNDDRAAGHKLSAESLYSQPLC